MRSVKRYFLRLFYSLLPWVGKDTHTVYQLEWALHSLRSLKKGHRGRAGAIEAAQVAVKAAIEAVKRI